MGIFQGGSFDALTNALLLRFKGSSLRFPNLDHAYGLHKNLLINGGLDYWQRNANAVTVTVAQSYRADRFLCRAGGSSAQMSVSRSTTVPNNQFKYSLAATENGDAVNNSMNFFQRIEAAAIRPYIGATMNFSIWYRNDSLATSPGLYIQTALTGEDVFATDPTSDPIVTSKDFGFQTNLQAWKRLDLTFTVPATAVNGLMVGMQQTAGYTGTPTVLTTGWMLTEGKTPPPFFQRAGVFPGHELILCQRYYEKSFTVDVTPGAGGATPIFVAARYTSATTAALAGIPFKVTKRAVPTITVFAPSGGGAGQIYDSISGATPAAANAVVGTNSFSLTTSGQTGLTTGQASIYEVDFTAESEL